MAAAAGVFSAHEQHGKRQVVTINPIPPIFLLSGIRLFSPISRSYRHPYVFTTPLLPYCLVSRDRLSFIRRLPN